jgi:hypothetical protein
MWLKMFETVDIRLKEVSTIALPIFHSYIEVRQNQMYLVARLRFVLRRIKVLLDRDVLPGVE